jgi:peptide/nickel transport system permease protein
MLTVFWTDGLLFALLLAGALAAWRSGRKEYLRRPWRKVSKSAGAMVSAVILAFYLLIALLDSIHFYPLEDGKEQFRTEAISVFDWMAAPLRNQVERTYSAPLSAFGWSRENLTEGDGQPRWAKPRLQFGGAHLQNPGRDLVPDVLVRLARGLILGGTVWCAMTWLLLRSRARRLGMSVRQCRQQILQGRTETPWRAILATSLFLSLAVFTLGDLSLSYHVFGTDKVGEDVLYQALKSIRTGILIGTLTTFVTLPLALSLGILAGYFRGWVDDVIQYVYTTLNSIPGVLLIAASMLLMQAYMAKHEADFASLAIRADFRLLFLCLILGMTSWTGLCRLLRAETLKLREMEYVQAARALGVRQVAILVRHILPNLFHLVLISLALDFSSLVLAEAVLSYVNIGVDPTTESWGNMINSARLEMARQPPVWWSLGAAFLFMFVLVLAANLFADAVRDAFDPRRAD